VITEIEKIKGENLICQEDLVYMNKAIIQCPIHRYSIYVTSISFFVSFGAWHGDYAITEMEKSLLMISNFISLIIFVTLLDTVMRMHVSKTVDK
jgi:hypothetical protein